MQQLLQFQYYNKKICSMIGLQINTTAVHFTSCVKKQKAITIDKTAVKQE